MHDERRPGFSVAHKATFAHRVAKPEITVGHLADDGTCDFEFTFVWEPSLQGPEPELKLSRNAWIAFERYPELFRRLAEMGGPPTSPDDMEDVLKELGFEDMTPYPPTPKP